MQINLILFDKIQESIHGTFRGFILVILLYCIDMLVNYKKIKSWNPKHYLIKFFLFLFVASALAINQAKSLSEAAVWGFGIGSTIYGCLVFNNMLTNLDNKTDINLKKQIMIYLIGVIQCILLSLLMYGLFFRNKNK